MSGPTFYYPPPEPGYVYCEWCGKEIFTEEIYCPYCGHEPFAPREACECRKCQGIRKEWRATHPRPGRWMFRYVNNCWPRTR